MKDITRFSIPGKEIHQSPKGHQSYKGGAGHHDSRPNRERKRGDAAKAAIKRSLG